MREQTACFTGHRKLPAGNLLPYARRLLDTVLGLADQGVIRFKSGGAIGFDQYAALAVIYARKDNPAIKLEMVLPHREQASEWSAKDKQIYDLILSQADLVEYVSERFYRGCMADRNLRLVEGSNYCVAYMTHGRSGTSQTVRFARERDVTVINLA